MRAHTTFVPGPSSLTVLEGGVVFSVTVNGNTDAEEAAVALATNALGASTPPRC